MKKNKLQLKKIQIAKLKSLNTIRGGTGNPNGAPTVNTAPGPNHTIDPDTDTIDTDSNPIRPLSSRPCTHIDTQNTDPGTTL
ncbi:hypothetical protein [Spongiimicrobium salis]|uniref:hypothetical protein n=1 Tax=Spongiimicrobium salis TaxID=1667022 RepID=UPI00374C99BD